MFDQIDQPLALYYYETGLSAIELEIETRHKMSADSQTEEQFLSDVKNIIPPELLNNIGSLRLEASDQLKLTNPQESKTKKNESFQAYTQALKNIELLNKINGQESTKLNSLKLTTLFNIAYWHENNHQFDQANTLYKQIVGSNPDYIDA